MKATILTIVGASILFTAAGLVEARTWTEAGSGRTLEGDLLRLEGENVLVRRSNGTVIPVPLDKLSDEDKEFVASKQKAATDDLLGCPPCLLLKLFMGSLSC